MMKGYHVTDGNEDLSIVTTTRAKATGAFIARFAGKIEWDGEEAWECWSDEWGMETYWGAPMP